MVDLPGIPFPKSLPFSVCVPDGTNVQCVSADNLVIGDTKECIDPDVPPTRVPGTPTMTTPPLASVDITYAKKEVTLDGLEVVTSLSFWVGIETDLGAIWIGESMGKCTRIPIDPPSPTAAVDDLVNEIQNYSGEISKMIEDHTGLNRGSTGNMVLSRLLLIVVALLIVAFPTGAPG